MGSEPTPVGARQRLAAWQGVLVLVVVGIGAQIAGGVAFVVAALIETRGSLGQLESAITFGTLLPSVIVTGLTMIVGSLLVVLLARRPVPEALGLRRAPWPAFVAAPFGILALGPTSDALRRLMQEYLPTFTLGSLDQLEAAARSAPLWAVIPLFAIVPGISEEILFRGAFQRSIRIRWLAVVLSGFFFALYHADPHHVAAVLPLGLFLAWVGDRTGSVLVPITAHAVNNGTAVLGSVLLGASDESSSIEELAIWVPAGWLVAAIAVAVICWSTRAKPPGPASVVAGDEPSAPVPESLAPIEPAPPER